MSESKGSNIGPELEIEPLRNVFGQKIQTANNI